MINRTRIAMLAAVLCASGACSGGRTSPAPTDTVRITFITDMSGPYESVNGTGGAEAFRMAVADIGGRVAGRTVELIVADHRNDVATAAAHARRLLEAGGADVIISGVNSDTSPAMAEVATAARKPFLAVGAGSAAHTGVRCSPYLIRYTYDTTALARTPGLLLPRDGQRRWFFVTGDHAFGHELERFGSEAVVSAG